MTVEQIRKLALAFPEAVEQEHFGNPSFRVRGRIFATVPDEEHVNVMIDPFDIDAAMRAEPESCEELRGVRISLSDAAAPMVDELLRAAWRRKAPKRLQR